MAHRDHAHRLSVMAMPIQVSFPMALTVAIELRVFEIIAESGPGAQLFPSEIVAKMPTTNPNAATALDRILRILVANSLLTVQETNDGEGVRMYGLTDQSRCLVPGDDGVSLAPLVLFCLQKPTLDCFYHLGASVLEGGPTPFHRTHGMDLFEYAATDQKFRGLFHEAMRNVTVIILTEVLEGYKGFSEVKEMVDVGGGNGTSINLIVSKYPHIRAVNYDLPCVIAGAPSYPGVEHIPEDMFESVPPTETIFMRGILHNWGDDKCLKLLMNCWKALPDGGKVISVEFVIPPILGTDHVSRFTTGLDLLIMPIFIGGKERPASEYCDLAKAAGFFETKVFPISNGIAVMEFCKRL
ncbi:(S)-scoulerine 9-O-methyltransferase-like [Magnolia sinica]|uniref:(S)-scoulerine 9-O-methyltransferase-like n=1 Tax=Magnolia sinica TaxID=86752 RepID=UPI00265B3E01|nr:(S)-scoulerine 9-O-methyltransferase-like [Magnolia sinica]